MFTQRNGFENDWWCTVLHHALAHIASMGAKKQAAECALP
jgi:hypothetical protein